MTDKLTYEELEQNNAKLEKTITELQYEKNLFRVIFEHAPLGILHFDSNGVITAFNDNFINIIGSSKEALTGLDMRMLPDTGVVNALEKALRGRIALFEGKYSSVTATKISLIRLIFSPIFSKEGIVEGGIGIIEDVTKQKRAEEALRASEEKHRKLVSNISDVIVILDKEGIITYKSPNITEQFGWAPDDLIGEHGLCTTHIDDQERIKKELTQLLKNDNTKVRVEYNYLCKDGSIRPIELTAVSMLNDPDINGILANYKDISQREQANEKLRKSEEKFRAAFKTSPNVITLTSVEDGTYVDVNDAFTKLLGYSQKDVIGESSLVLNIWNDSKDRDLLVSGLKKNGLVENLPAEFKGKNGQIINGLMSARFLDIENKKYLLAVTQDITEFKQTEKERLNLEIQLQQAQKMESIGTLAGGIAHDFNNILFPILGYTEMLKEDAPEDSPLQDSLNKIYTSAIRAKDLVTQILTFSRQEGSELKRMKIQPIVKEALKLIRSTIPTTIAINQDISDCGVIKANPTQIHQIVMNLATNAYHAMEKNGGVLKISLKEMELEVLDLITSDMIPGVYARLTIADSGVGMDKKLTEKIFDPFFTTKEKGKGTGMGLSVVHGIVHGMRGAVQVYSEPGKGTEFHVYLPMVKKSSEEQVTYSKIEIQAGTEQILLVDDEEAILTMEKQMLEHLGYQVTSRTSSIEALEAFSASPDKFDMVITDMAMPNMPGDKFTVELIKIRPDIPVLLCTGFSETMSEEKAAAIGIKGLLFKPIVMKDFSHKIRALLDDNEA